MSAEVYNGFLALYKPAGMSSHDAVLRVRRSIRQKRVGHTGTLDRAAEGLLLLCIGKAARAARFVSDCDKVYRGVVRFGRRSATFDAEGVDESTPEQPVPSRNMEEMQAVCDEFVGMVTQQVPLYSAVRVDGVRLYERARRGEDVTPPTRTVTIHSIRVIEWNNPELTIEVCCSSGTYIRSLAHELGERLGCGGYLAHLCRTAVGRVTLDDALSLDRVRELHSAGTLAERLLPLDRVVDYPAIHIRREFVRSLIQGQPPHGSAVELVTGPFVPGQRVMVKNGDGRVLAVGRAAVGSTEITRELRRPALTFERVLV